MRCPRCQAQNPADAVFCEECGARLEACCASCGEPNRLGAKFCKKCGQRLVTPELPGPTAPPKFGLPTTYPPKHLAEKILTSKAAHEGERKQVTVLFADLKESMELLADRDPVEARRRGRGHLQTAEFLYEASLFPELEYTFKHALTHEVAYGSLLHERPGALHARIVEAIERLYPERFEEQTEGLAHHALRGALWPAAVQYLRWAGQRARSWKTMVR